MHCRIREHFLLWCQQLKMGENIYVSDNHAPTRQSWKYAPPGNFLKRRCSAILSEAILDQKFNYPECSSWPYAAGFWQGIQNAELLNFTGTIISSLNMAVGQHTTHTLKQYSCTTKMAKILISVNTNLLACYRLGIPYPTWLVPCCYLRYRYIVYTIYVQGFTVTCDDKLSLRCKVGGI